MTTASDFYDHKREAHNGNYKNDCPVCQQKWAALVQESKAKAGTA